MSKYKFHHPISVRYEDIDSQRHVNNVRFLSYMEDARFSYLVHLGLFDGRSFQDLPLIVGDHHCRYHLPIDAGEKVVVSLGITRIGNKSLTIEYEIIGQGGTPLYATAETIMVGYNYTRRAAMPITGEFRNKVSDFEGIDFSARDA